jgi:hypothetical protein
MEQLIEAVRNHRVLWDTRLPEYRDLNVREKAWSEIATGLKKESKLLIHMIVIYFNPIFA